MANNEAVTLRGEPLPPGAVEMQRVESSNVWAVGYDAEFARLFVEFTTGATYRYDGVEKDVYESLMAAESVGKFLNANIKERYATTKVS